MTIELEYRVKEVTRFIVTRYHSDGGGSSVEGRGEYGNPDIAFEVAYALCKRDHDLLGWPLGDDRIRYPSRIDVHASPIPG
jgi:hypothetical protein